MSDLIDSNSEGSSSSDALWSSLAEILESASRASKAIITPNTELANDLGLDSVTLIDTVMVIERTLHVEIDERALASVRSAGDLADLIRRAPRREAK